MRMGKRLYSLVMFLLVSVLGGLLLAGLAVPVTGLAAETGKAAAESLQTLPEELATPPQSERSKVLLADGSVLNYFFNENRQYVPLDQISPIMRQAQVAIEDHRFHEHGAIDLTGTIRALVRTSSGNTQGGSTLTQQYVKLVLVEEAASRGDKEALAQVNDRTVAQKVRELRYAIAVEDKLAKDLILERYLNLAYYGDGAYGVEAAARHYFNVSAKDLDLAQSAMLAGLVRNPVTSDPVNHPLVALERRSNVLSRMVELKLVSAEDAAAAKATPFDRSKVLEMGNGCVSSRYPFICQFVERTLLETPSLGADRQSRKNLLYRGGLTIQTGIDPRIQDASEAAIIAFLKPTDPVISVAVTMQPGTGVITSMAQNKNRMGTGPGETYYNFAVTKKMGGAEGYQGGSTFKGFTVAAALEKGVPVTKSYNAASHVDFTGQWFSSCDGRFRSTKFPVDNAGRSGQMTMLEGAKYSVNTYMVMLERDVGLCNVTKMAEKLGLKLSMGGSLVQKYHKIPSFTLGTAEVSLLSMVEAYATFAARGLHCDPVVVLSATNRDGQPLAVPGGNCQQVIPQSVADGINLVMGGAFTEGGTAFSARPAGNWDISGKTGTVTGGSAVWTVGYTPEVVAAGMIAVEKTNPYYQGRSLSLEKKRMPSGTYLVGSSGREAGRMIFRPAMTAALVGKPNTRFHDPSGEVINGKRVAVPSCKGMSLDACRAVVEQAGFTTQVSRVASDRPVGTFLGPSPTGMAPQFSTISLRVSSGPAPVVRPTTAAPPPTAPSAPAAAPPKAAPAAPAPGQTKPGKP